MSVLPTPLSVSISPKRRKSWKEYRILSNNFRQGRGVQALGAVATSGDVVLDIADSSSVGDVRGSMGQ